MEDDEAAGAATPALLGAAAAVPKPAPPTELLGAAATGAPKPDDSPALLGSSSAAAAAAARAPKPNASPALLGAAASGVQNPNAPTLAQTQVLAAPVEAETASTGGVKRPRVPESSAVSVVTEIENLGESVAMMAPKPDASPSLLGELPGAAAAAGAPKPDASPMLLGAAAAGAPEPNAPTLAQIRALTAPVKAKAEAEAAATGGVKRPCVSESSAVSVSTEVENLGKSLAVIGLGLTKVISGFGIKLNDASKKAPEKKDADKKAPEKKDAEKNAPEQKDADKNVPEKKGFNSDVDADDKDGCGADASAKDGCDTGAAKSNKEKDKQKQNGIKQKTIRVLVVAPSGLVSVSTVLTGLSEMATGGYDSARVMGRLISAVPALITSCKGYAEVTTRLISGIPALIGIRNKVVLAPSDKMIKCKLGTGHLGLHILLDRQVLVRSSTGKIVISDGYGLRSIIPDNLSGTRLINTEAELTDAIKQFKSGNASQVLDVDKNHISLVTAHVMWSTLRNEHLTGLFKQGSALPEMALRASALLEDEKAMKGMLKQSEKVVDELKICCCSLREKLERIN